MQYSNGTLSTSDKAAITAEVAQLSAEVGKIASDTKFNGIQLLSGGGSITFQIGAEQGQTLSVSAVNLSADVAAPTALDFSNGASISLIDQAIEKVATDRATFGAVQNRLEHTMNNLANYEENLTGAESRIRDVDMAEEMTTYTKLNILQQAGTSMLAQANQAPQGVLSLLR